MAEILVAGEADGGGLDSATAEMIAAARGLGGEVAVALFGSGLDGPAAEAIAVGADKVLLVEHDLLDTGGADAQVAALEQVCRQTEATVVLLGRTALGRDVGPRVAFRLGAGLAQDCVDIGLDAGTGRVIVRRPVYGGNAVATATFGEGDPQFVILRAKAYEPLEPDPSREGQITRLDVDLEPSMIRVRHIETVESAGEGVRLEDAAVVVSGGRGLGGPEPFEKLEELAGLLGGAVGASRAACDAGWVDYSHQVGLTGKTITPKVYITVGISGASQHMAGCSGAKNIVAVNRDREANMFKEASYGVVGDWEKVLPAFIETVRELVKS
jgi:electron transfer flavoprotein alpha subunit